MCISFSPQFWHSVLLLFFFLLHLYNFIEMHLIIQLDAYSNRLSSSFREVSEPSTAAITEVEPDSESPTPQQPASGAEPESNESRLEEVRSLKGVCVCVCVLWSRFCRSLTCILACESEPYKFTLNQKSKWF